MAVKVKWFYHPEETLQEETANATGTTKATTTTNKNNKKTNTVLQYPCNVEYPVSDLNILFVIEK